MSQRQRQTAGLLLTALLSILVLSVFYGNLFGKLNRVSFAAGGDGLQSYVNTLYHIRFDSSYMRCNSMNYPYGEHVFFANNQPLISNTIKFISANIIDISDHTLGILNFIMLFCLVIAPVILYLILTGAGAGILVSSLAAIGIAYLSPQLDRFGGHFNLSYVCAIPLMILLLQRFFKKPSGWLSVAIFVVVMAGTLSHFYYYGFFAILLLFFYGAELFSHNSIFRNRLSWALHLFIQLVMPYLILQAFYISDHVTDRTSYPWGFFVYRAYPQSVFLPFSKPYGRFLLSFIDTGFIDWEGYAFVGTMAVCGFFVLMAAFARKLLYKQYDMLWKVTRHPHLNILFWASLAALLYSFGLPFLLGMQGLVDLIGPVRQMRGIARFAWLFFYIMNLVTVVMVWDYLKNSAKKAWPVLLLVAALAMLLTDAYYNGRNRGKLLENHIAGLTDRNLAEPENQWIGRIDINQYQAVIPLPYFHIGSENIWIDGGCDIIPKTYLAIVNSGLPSTGALLSRTSLSQTVDNVALMLQPSTAAVDMARFPSQKPFLLLAARCDLLSEHERQLIARASLLDSTGNFDLYALPFRAFNDIADSLQGIAIREYHTLSLYSHQAVLSTDSMPTFRFLSYDSLPNSASLSGTGCYEGPAKNENLIFSGTLPSADTAWSYTVSFWMNHVKSDLYPRTRVTLSEQDTAGNIVFNETYPVSKHFETIYEDWVLISLPCRIRDQENTLKVTLQNKTLRNKPLRVDNLLIRPQKTGVYLFENGYLQKNNGIRAVALKKAQ
jgi:hypothetical protein